MTRHYSNASHNTPGWEEGTYYKILRFKTGETLLCVMESDVKSIATETYCEMIRPCIRSIAAVSNVAGDTIGEQYNLSPWVGSSSSEAFTIPIEMVLTIADMNPYQIAQYKAYWSVIETKERVQKVDREADIRDTELFAFLLSISVEGKLNFINEEEPAPQDTVTNIQPPQIMPPMASLEVSEEDIQRFMKENNGKN